MKKVTRDEYIERLSDYQAETDILDLKGVFLRIKELYKDRYAGFSDNELEVLFNDNLTDIK